MGLDRIAFLAPHPARRSFMPYRRFAEPQRKERVGGGVGLQPGDARELLIINGVANLVHCASLA